MALKDEMRRLRDPACRAAVEQMVFEIVTLVEPLETELTEIFAGPVIQMAVEGTWMKIDTKEHAGGVGVFDPLVFTLVPLAASILTSQPSSPMDATGRPVITGAEVCRIARFVGSARAAHRAEAIAEAATAVRDRTLAAEGQKR